MVLSFLCCGEKYQKNELDDIDLRSKSEVFLIENIMF